VRRTSLNALLLYTFFMVLGFAMLMPLVSVHFVSNMGMTATVVGAALAVRQLTQQGLAVVGGVLADRFGARPMICLGVLLRAAGFASLAFADDARWLFVAMAVSAIGGALFEAPYQAAIASLATEQTRTRYYAVSNWIMGVASTLGPLVGVALLRWDFRIVCLVAAACFALNFVIALMLPPLGTASARQPFTGGLQLVVRDRPFLALTLVMTGYWFTAVQMNISFPLQAERLTGSQSSVGVMLAVGAALTVLLQYALVRLLERWLAPTRILVAGMALMALGTGAVGLAPNFAAFLVCVAVVAIGAVLVRPTLQSLTAEMANPKALGTFLGISSLSLAVGGAAGNISGGWLIDLSRALNVPHLAWTVYGIVGLISVIGLGLLTRRCKPRIALEAA
jgi:DHA1 family multidrug resistance protein-like MFS transporter